MAARPLAPSDEDIGKLVLRLTLGVLLLLHGMHKLSHGVTEIAGMLRGAHLPEALAYGAYIGEVLAPILLIAGAWTRLAAAVVVVNMLVAIGLAHAAQLLTLGPQGGWALELQGFYLFSALAIALMGAGRLSVGGMNGRFN